jgi:hypothetical protein
MSVETTVPLLPGIVTRGLAEIASVKEVADGLLVTTHCMYPSNGLVQVKVSGGIRTVVASDEGGAISEATAAGIPMHDRALNHLVKDQGLFIREGVVFSPKMPIEAAPLAILLVANASQEVARWLFEHTTIKRTRDFRAMLAEFLLKKFDNRVSHNETIVGHSNKPHRFANVINIGDRRRLIIDPVSNEASSINARVIANLDIKAVDDPLIIQRLVYDDEDDWSAADLNLLQVGAPVVPFSRVAEVLERIAA